MTFLARGLQALLDARQDVGHPLVEVGIARLEPHLRELELGEVLRVAAELDVDAAAGHVRRDGDGAGLARLGDDLPLALGVLGLRVEDGVADAALAQHPGEQLGDLDGDRAHEHRLAGARWRVCDLAARRRCHLPPLVL